MLKRLKEILFLLLFLILFQQAFAAEALPPLVPAGENFADFPDWAIDKHVLYSSVTFSPDGKMLATASDDKFVKLWDVESRRLLHIFRGHTDEAWAVAFSPDGKTLASGSKDNSVKLWDVDTRRILCTLQEHSNPVGSVAFSPDGKMLASGGEDNTVKLWDVDTQKLLHTFPIEGSSSRVLSVTFSPDGKILASGRENDPVMLWDIHTLQLLPHTFDGLNHVAFSPDGKILAAGGTDNTVKLWDVNTQSLLHTFEGHTNIVWTVKFSPNGKILASGASDNTIKIWDVDAQHLLDTFEGHSNEVLGIAFSPNSKMLASAADESIKIWDMNTRRLLHTFRGHSRPSESGEFSTALSPDGKILAITDAANTIQLWDTQKGVILKTTLNGHSDSVLAMAFSPDGNVLASGSADHTVRLWDTRSGAVLKTLKDHDRSVLTVAFSPDGNVLASGSHDDTVRLWDTQSGAALNTLKDHGNSVSALAFSPDGKTLASGSWDNTVRLWNMPTGTPIKTMTEHINSISALAFGPDGKTLASGSDDKTVKLWDVGSQRLLQNIDGHKGRVVSVAYSPDSKKLISGSDDKIIKIWDIGTRNLLRTFNGEKSRILSATNGEKSRILSATFNPKGEVLGIGLDDTSMKLWNLDTQRLMYNLLAGTNGNWISWDDSGKFQRGDDGSLLLTLNGKDYIPAVPKLAEPLLSSALTAEWDGQILRLNSGETSPLKLKLTNTSSQPIYWIQADVATDAIFNIETSKIMKLLPQQTQEMEIRISAHASHQPEPHTETLTLKLVAPQQTETSIDIPVEIHAPQLQFETAALQDDQRTLNVSVLNHGNQPISNTIFGLKVPGFELIDSQTVKEPIPANGRVERAFILPEGFKPDKNAKISLDIRTTNLPLFTWNFNEQSLTLPRPAWWMYAALASLLMLTSLGVFYFRRYRHPLVLELAASPQALLYLPLEQLAEAQQRLQQTGRLNTTLASAEVSLDTLNKAANFQQDSADKKAQSLASRLSAQLTEMTFAAEEAGAKEIYSLKLPETFPLNADRLLIYFPTTDAQDTFTHLQAIPQAEGRITLIIGPDSAYQRKLLNATQDPSNKYVAPQSRQITELLLSPHADTVLAKIMSEQLALTQISPYQTGGGVNKESIFFGRRELIAQIINRDPANYLLVGGRQMGKSSLLKALERRYASNPHVQCQYHTLSNEVMVPRLASALQLPRTDDAETFAAALEQRIRDTDQRFVFLIDEADRFIEHEQAQGYPILNVFRRLSEQGHCSFILTGFWQLYQHAVLDYQSPLRNFGEVLEVGALERDACYQLITQPMHTMNLGYASDAIVQDMVRACGQRANLIAYVCHQLIKDLPAQQRIITAGDIHHVLTSREMNKRLEGWVVGISEQEQRYDRLVIYATIGKESFSTGELIKQLEEQNLTFDTAELERTLSRLELAFIFTRENNRWRYRVPLFVDYIRADDPDVKLATILKQW